MPTNTYTKIPMVNQPPGMKIQLFKHQLAIIHKMENLEHSQVVQQRDYIKETKIGINGDLTGFGKTYSMLGLIIRDKIEWCMDTPFIDETISVESGGLIKRRTIKRYEKLPTTLILVSSSIIGQWEEEISNTKLRAKVITNKKIVDTIKVEDYDVILVTPSMYNNLVKSYNEYAWKRFIFDEPGHTRVAGMATVKAGFIWFVTATPNAIISKHIPCVYVAAEGAILLDGHAQRERSGIIRFLCNERGAHVNSVAHGYRNWTPLHVAYVPTKMFTM